MAVSLYRALLLCAATDWVVRKALQIRREQLRLIGFNDVEAMSKPD